MSQNAPNSAYTTPPKDPLKKPTAEKKATHSKLSNPATKVGVDPLAGVMPCTVSESCEAPQGTFQKRAELEKLLEIRSENKAGADDASEGRLTDAIREAVDIAIVSCFHTPLCLTSVIYFFRRLFLFAFTTATDAPRFRAATDDVRKPRGSVAVRCGVGSCRRALGDCEQKKARRVRVLGRLRREKKKIQCRHVIKTLSFFCFTARSQRAALRPSIDDRNRKVSAYASSACHHRAYRVCRARSARFGRLRRHRRDVLFEELLEVEDVLLLAQPHERYRLGVLLHGVE